LSNPPDITTKTSTPVCTSCGACCRNFPFVKILQSDVDRLEAFTGDAPVAFSNIDEIDSDKLFMKFNDSGDCVYLKKVAGRYACGVYEARPDICRAYPANNVENNACRVNSQQAVIVDMSGRAAI